MNIIKATLKYLFVPQGLPKTRKELLARVAVGITIWLGTELLFRRWAARLDAELADLMDSLLDSPDTWVHDIPEGMIEDMGGTIRLVEDHEAIRAGVDHIIRDQDGHFYTVSNPVRTTEPWERHLGCTYWVNATQAEAARKEFTELAWSTV